MVQQDDSIVHIDTSSSVAPPEDAPIPDDPTPKSKSSAMDEVFANSDILAHIFSFFPIQQTYSKRETGIEERRQLVQIALTCKLFRDPALDRLWRSLESVVPILRLIPEVEVGTDGYGFPDVLSFDDNFLKHARRVRSLHIESTDLPHFTDTDSYALMLLSQNLRNQPLFPSLESLDLHALPPHFSWNSLSMLLSSPALTSVSISGEFFESPWFLKLVMPLLVSRTGATLRKLSLRGNTEAVPPAVWTALASPSFKALRELEVCFPRSLGMPTDFFLRLGKAIPRLEHLTLDAHLDDHRRSSSEPDSDSPQPEYPSDIFKYLKTLSFAITIGLQDKTCQCYSIPPFTDRLTTLVIYPVEADITNALNSLGSDLAERGYTSLRHVEMRDFSGSTDLTITEAQLVSIIKHLPELESLKFPARPWLDLGTTKEEVVAAYKRIFALVSSRCRTTPAIAGREVVAERSGSAGTSLRALHFPETKSTDIDLVALGSLVTAQATFPPELRISINSNGSTMLSIPPLPPLDVTDGYHGSGRALERLELIELRGDGYPFTPQEFKTIARYLDACFPDLQGVAAVTDRSSQWAQGMWSNIDLVRSLYRENRLLRMSSRV